MTTWEALAVGRLPVGSGSDLQDTMATRGRSSSSLRGDAAWQFLPVTEVSNRHYVVDTLAVSRSVRAASPTTDIESPARSQIQTLTYSPEMFAETPH
jgi:hypothetical protein